MNREECKLHIHEGKMFLTTVTEDLKNGDKVWAYNAAKYNRCETHYQNSLEPYYEFASVQAAWIYPKGFVLANIRFNEKEMGINMKASGMRKVVLEGSRLEVKLTPKMIETIMQKNNGVCYLDMNNFPTSIHLLPGTGNEAMEETIIKKYEQEKKSDEALHAQYEPAEEELADKYSLTG